MPIIDATKAGAPGDIMDAQFYGAPGPCAKLDATKAGEILARLLERPASQEAPSARLRWFSEWAAAARPPPSQLKSLCVRATVECDRLYGRNRPERDFSPYFLCATLEELAAILESDTALAPGGLHPAVRQAVDITRR
ncbi:MAG: hypothetical protein LBJ10_06270, partial [Clostridiales bacterium]|nr:hypothetical protein [Clostridiales bacterium]